MRLTMLHLLLRKNGYYIFQFQMVRHLVTDPKYGFLKQLGISIENPGLYDGRWGGSGKLIESISPATGKVIAKVCQCAPQEVSKAVTEARKAWPQWASIPRRTRTDIIGQIGDEFGKNFDALACLISLEMGKILPEAEGEVQEFINICNHVRCMLSKMITDDYLVQRTSNNHKYMLLTKWNPLGVIGVISPFNLPIAVYGWNAVIAMSYGNTVVWKPASSTSLIAIATTSIITSVLERNGIPGSVASLITGGPDVGETLVNDKRVSLISFTGSTNVGRQVALKIQQRFGKSLLALGGNNALVVAEDADLEIAVKGAILSCVGTTGTRCTNTRRLILHKKIKDEFLGKLKTAYKSVLERVGDPLDEGVLYGPLHNQRAVDAYKAAIKKAVKAGGKIEFGGKQIERAGFFVQPTIISGLPASAEMVQQETFAPIVYILETNSLEEAIDLNNGVEQGWNSSLFTKSFENISLWIGPYGSNCGISNVNVGISDAEINGVFGSKKPTEPDFMILCDMMKHYMGRITITIDIKNELPLAEKIEDLADFFSTNC